MELPKGTVEQLEQAADLISKDDPVVVSSSSSGTIPYIGGSVITTTTGTSQITIGGSGCGSSPPTLTLAEQQELEILRKDFKDELKKDKLNIFKALPSAIRQFTIDMIEWDNCRIQMNLLHKAMSPRLQELEHKEQKFNALFKYSGYASLDTILGYEQHISLFSLPGGITSEDLKIAHLEATLEENMAQNDSNS